MKIGIMSAAFPSLSFEQVLGFLSENGFDPEHAVPGLSFPVYLFRRLLT